MGIRKKRRGLALEVKTIKGKDGTYLFFRLGNSYHTFVEVEAKAAARDCGATKEGNTQEMCKEVWKKARCQ